MVFMNVSKDGFSCNIICPSKEYRALQAQVGTVD